MPEKVKGLQSCRMIASRARDVKTGFEGHALSLSQPFRFGPCLAEEAKPVAGDHRRADPSDRHRRDGHRTRAGGSSRCGAVPDQHPWSPTGFVIAELTVARTQRFRTTSGSWRRRNRMVSSVQTIAAPSSAPVSVSHWPKV